MDTDIKIIKHNGIKIIEINSIEFSGKRKIDWDGVEDYLKRFIGESYTIDETDDVTCRVTDTLVECIADAIVFFGNHFRNIRFVFGYYVQGVVSRCPVYDDILFVGVILADDAENSVLNSLFAIVGYGDYADLGAGHFFNTC